MMSYNKFLPIYNTDVLGHLNMHYGPLPEYSENNCLMTVFEVVEIKIHNHYIFNPGFMSFDDIFFPCPLSNHYVQLNFIEEIIEGNNMILKADIVIFSKNFKKNRTISISQKSPRYGSGRDVGTPGDFIVIINRINKYIDLDQDIDLIDESIFQKKFHTSLSVNKLMALINNIKFDFIHTESHQPGKDKRQRTQIKISNLPESKYLSSLFYDILIGSRLISNESIHDESKHVSKLKDYLKFKISEKFDAGKYESESLLGEKDKEK